MRSELCFKIYTLLDHWVEKGWSEVSHSVVSDSLWPHGLGLTRLFCLWDSPGKNPGADYHFLFREIFLTQGSNPGLLHSRLQVDSLPCKPPRMAPDCCNFVLFCFIVAWIGWLRYLAGKHQCLGRRRRCGLASRRSSEAAEDSRQRKESSRTTKQENGKGSPAANEEGTK